MPQHIMPVHLEAYTNKQLVEREGGREGGDGEEDVY